MIESRIDRSPQPQAPAGRPFVEVTDLKKHYMMRADRKSVV